MSVTPREIGTLVVVILKAQHLPNKRHIGKQDPYCCITLNGEKRRTRAIKRGGQHPEWDEEVRFTLFEDTEDTLARAANGGETPPPPPPKDGDGKRKKKVKGGNNMLVACYADEPKEPELIGETVVDLTEVLSKGETDEWFTLSNKDKFSGEVYLELTFWSNEKPPEKKSKIQPSKQNKQYGGPGSFVPSESENGVGHADQNSLPASLRASSSLAQLDLYTAPYDERNSTITERRQGSGSTINQVADEFGGLSMGHNPHRRRESFPPVQHGHPQRPDSAYSSVNSSSSYHSNSYGSHGHGSAEYSDPGQHYSYDAPSTPVGRPHYHRNSFGDSPHSYPTYQSPYDPSPGHSSGYSPSHVNQQPEYGAPMYNVPSASSGFVPIPNPEPSGFAPVPTSTPGPSGFAPPPSHTPAPSGYAPPPAQTPVPMGYGPPPSHTPAPSGFMPPGPPQSAMGYHQSPPPIQTWSSWQPYPQPASAPPMAYQPQAPGPPSSVPPPSHSAPLQHYSTAPSPSHAPPPQQYPAYAPSTPSPPQPPPQQYNPSPPVHGSRPLPTPAQQNGSPYTATPPNPVGPTPSYTGTPTHQGSVMYTPPHSYPLPNPPGPPPQMHSNPPPPPMQHQQRNGFIPPPPPPPLNNSRMSGPPPPPLQVHQHNSQEMHSPHGQSPSTRPPLPQPPTGAGGAPPPPPSGFHPPPPPPPIALMPSVQQNAQHPLPMPPPPQGPVKSVRPGEIYNPGLPPRPPAQVVYDSNTGFWNAPQY